MAAAVVFPAGLPRGARPPRQQDPARPGPASRSPTGSAQRALAFGVGAASSREIDRLNIRVATALAMRRAIARRCSGRAGRSPTGPTASSSTASRCPRSATPTTPWSTATPAASPSRPRPSSPRRCATCSCTGWPAAIPATAGRPTSGYGTAEHQEALGARRADPPSPAHLRPARAADTAALSVVI